MVANFYYEWSKAAVVIGVVAGLGLVIALGLTRRRLVSALCSAVGCGLIAFCAWTFGDSDHSVVGLVHLVISVPLAAIVGGLAGLISASVMRDRKRPAKHRPEGIQDKSPDASQQNHWTDAGGRRQLPIRKSLAARVGQIYRWATTRT